MQRVMKLEKQGAGYSVLYQEDTKNKKGVSYCKTSNTIKSEKEL